LTACPPPEDKQQPRWREHVRWKYRSKTDAHRAVTAIAPIAASARSAAGASVWPARREAHRLFAEMGASIRAEQVARELR